MTKELFEKAKFGDRFVTRGGQEALFLRLTENEEWQFADFYVKDWGLLKVIRENGKCINGPDIENDIVGMNPSLPSNLDEVAEENSKNYYCSCLENHNETGICDGCENVKLAFKAGAEWMAGQVMMLKWKYPEEKYQYPECLTRIMDEYGDWHYTISEGHLNPDCEYISLAELSLRLVTRL